MTKNYPTSILSKYSTILLPVFAFFFTNFLFGQTIWSTGFETADSSMNAYNGSATTLNTNPDNTNPRTGTKNGLIYGSDKKSLLTVFWQPDLQ